MVRRRRTRKNRRRRYRRQRDGSFGGIARAIGRIISRVAPQIARAATAVRAGACCNSACS